MPQRPRSHELEDLSIDRLLGIRPLSWAARRKSADYGVDLEFEIFDEADKYATGLLFYVQIRATDSKTRAHKLSLTVEQMQYFFNLPVPTIVVRYAASENVFYWQWHFVIAAATDIVEGQKSFTYNFSEEERWTDDTPLSIRQTLTVRRLIETYRPTAPVQLRFDTTDLPAKDRYTVENGIHQAIEASPHTLQLSDDVQFLTLDIRASPNQIVIALDRFASLTIMVDDYSQSEVRTSVLYCSAAILAHRGLTHQAQQIARAVLALGQPHRSKFVGAEVARAIIGDIGRSVDLALLNGIHSRHDEHYMRYVAAFLTAPTEAAERSIAVIRFFDAALVEAKTVSPWTEASVHYSIANFYSRSDVNLAMRHYNKARRLRREYETTDYFLRELGACLFSIRRYRCAASCYERAMAFGSTYIDNLHLGDALLLSGNLAHAKAEFEAAAKSDDLFTTSEAILKAELCDWLIEYVGSLTAPVRTIEARNALPPRDVVDIEKWDYVTRKVDATNEIAHFNLAVARAKEGRLHEALGGFLLCAFKQSGDLESWANAAICCHNGDGDPQLFTLVLATAISLRGRITYDHLRDTLLDQSASDGTIERLDDVARQLLALDTAKQSRDFTIRAFRSHYYDVTQDSDTT